MNVYKVVLLRGEEMVSTFVFGEASVEYVIGQEARAPAWLEERGYFPLAFATLIDAILYRAGAEIVLLCECDEEDVIRYDNLPPNLKALPLGNKEFIPSHDAWYPGAIMAKKLTPRSIVSYE